MTKAKDEGHMSILGSSFRKAKSEDPADMMDFPLIVVYLSQLVQDLSNSSWPELQLYHMADVSIQEIEETQFGVPVPREGCPGDILPLGVPGIPTFHHGKM